MTSGHPQRMLGRDHDSGRRASANAQRCGGAALGGRLGQVESPYFLLKQYVGSTPRCQELSMPVVSLGLWGPDRETNPPIQV